MKKNNIKEFLLYLVVGGIATVTEWVLFFIMDKCYIHYAIATIIACLLSTFVNWLAGRLLVFKESHSSFLKEILSIYKGKKKTDNINKKNEKRSKTIEKIFSYKFGVWGVNLVEGAVKLLIFILLLLFVVIKKVLKPGLYFCIAEYKIAV